MLSSQVVEERRPECMSARVCFKTEPHTPPKTADHIPFKELNGREIVPEPPKTALPRSSKRHRHGYYMSMRFPIQGKRIRLCFNGDRFSKPIAYSISAFKTFDAFLKDVNSKVGRHAALLYGARHIFSTDGILIDTLDDMCHNSTYVCASTPKFVPLNYDEVGVPKWCSTLTKKPPLSRPSVTRHKYQMKRNRQSSMPSECGDKDMGLNATREGEVPNLPDTEIIGFLGRGHSAEVFKAFSKNRIFAAKVIALKNEKMREFVSREIEIMKALRWEHVIKLYRTYEYPDVGQVIELEYMPDGDLFDYMKTNKVLDEYNCASVMHCLGSALAYMHSQNIVHRDIKPENLLVYFDENKLVRVKITDLGLATRVKKNQVLFTVCGTPTYVAPEIVAKEGYSFECDCWSSGIIMYLLLAGFPPFYTTNDDQCELFDQILEAKVILGEEALPGVSWSSKLILRKLLLRDPKERSKARELVNEKWIKGPERITQADEAAAAHRLDMLEEHVARGPLPRPMARTRRSSNPDSSIRPSEILVNHRAHTQYSAKPRKTGLQNSQLSSLNMTDDDVYEESDEDACSEDGQLENGDFVYYRPK